MRTVNHNERSQLVARGWSCDDPINLEFEGFEY
jgi:hypothetical protein